MKVKRRFFLGDEWVYLKVYASVGMQSKLLSDEIFIIVHKLYKLNKISLFFFVRYEDKEGSHLRLRFLLKNIDELSSCLILINKKLNNLVEKRVIRKVIADTYVRELERYGGNCITIVEEIFSINSIVILDDLKQTKGKEDNLIWLKSVYRIDRVLEYLNFSLENRHILYEELYQSFFSYYDNSPYNKDQFKAEFRINRPEIVAYFKNKRLPPNMLEMAAVSSLKNKLNSVAGKKHFNSLLKDIIHMNFNRLYANNQNLLECVIYYMMSNYYKSCLMQEKKMLF